MSLSRSRSLHEVRWGMLIVVASVGCFVAGCPQQGDPTDCTFNDVTYAQGEAFDAPDGCNQCVCGGGGAITCTQVDACRTPQPDPRPEPDVVTPEPTPEFDGGAVDAGAVDAGALDAGVDAGALDAGRADAGILDAGPLDGGALDAGAPIDGGPRTCEIPEVGTDGCPCGYLDRPQSVGGDDATFEAACAARPVCESSCCGAGYRPDVNDVRRCVGDDNIPPSIDVVATSFAGTGPSWGFEIRGVSFGADRCRVTGTAGDRSYDFIDDGFPSVSFTSSSLRYDLSRMSLTFLCDNAFGLAVERFQLSASSGRLRVTPTSEGSPFRGLVCLEDLFDGPCTVSVCGGAAVVDEELPLGGQCSGGYVATLDMPAGPACIPVDALVLASDQDFLASCQGPDGFRHAFRVPMATALANP